jgi:hypothetical protein
MSAAHYLQPGHVSAAVSSPNIVLNLHFLNDNSGETVPPILKPTFCLLPTTVKFKQSCTSGKTAHSWGEIEAIGSREKRMIAPVKTLAHAYLLFLSTGRNCIKASNSEIS